MQLLLPGWNVTGMQEIHLMIIHHTQSLQPKAQDKSNEMEGGAKWRLLGQAL